MPPPPPPLAQFFKLYTELLKSDNYVTRRQSLKLLGELLLDRSNVKIMMQARGAGGMARPANSKWPPCTARPAAASGARTHPLLACRLPRRQCASPRVPVAARLRCDRRLALLPPRPRPSQYVADVDNLCLMMNLLKDPSRSIQFEAFHVFKVSGVRLCACGCGWVFVGGGVEGVVWGILGGWWGDVGH